MSVRVCVCVCARVCAFLSARHNIEEAFGEMPLGVPAPVPRTFEIGTPSREVTRAWDIMPFVELPGSIQPRAFSSWMGAVDLFFGPAAY